MTRRKRPVVSPAERERIAREQLRELWQDRRDRALAERVNAEAAKVGAPPLFDVSTPIKERDVSNNGEPS